MAKNTLTSGNVYNAYYGDFRGVDFSSDHTQVNKQRLAYSVNMFKDYQSGQGKALETIPGFRRRFQTNDNSTIYGIHHFQCRNEEGKIEVKVLVHAGANLYLWDNYPLSTGVIITKILPHERTFGGLTFIYNYDNKLKLEISKIEKITTKHGDIILEGKGIKECYNSRGELSIKISDKEVTAEEEDNFSYISVSYYEGEIKEPLFSSMNKAKSTSFIFNNRLYLIDGKNYLVYDGEKITNVTDDAYIPNTYINIIPGVENANNGTEYEQRNILQPKFKHTFIADGTTTEFYMNEDNLDYISEVKVYGEVVDNYEVDLINAKITFSEPPQRPEDSGYPEVYAGIEITASKTIKNVYGVTEDNNDIKKLVTQCTLATIFDNRVFLSGNPNYPNHVFYCERNTTGYVDPTFFGILNYMQDGVGASPITGMIPVADTLMILKNDTQQDGSTYFHTGVETGNDIQPKVYPSSQGLSGIGCLGACINFLDDPIFISRLGVEAVGQLSVRYERAIEHRSSLVDAKLVNLDLESAVLDEWNGYLILLVDGKIFMADSRQKYTHEIGVPQYEWYYLEGIGVYDDQYTEYRYATQIPSDLKGKIVHFTTDDDEEIELPLELADNVYDTELDETHNLTGEIVNAPTYSGNSSAKVFEELIKFEFSDIEDDENSGGDEDISNTNEYSAIVYFTVHKETDGKYHAFLCETKGNKTGGVFNKAKIVKTMDDNLFFGTENGVVCSFNFDMRDENGEISPVYYAFDDRAIFSGCATKMDNCDIPHLTKNTVKKSTVIKTKTLQNSATKIKVRTNKKPYEQIARINSTVFSFDNVGQN